jgi:hypothetical protein
MKFSNPFTHPARALVLALVLVPALALAGGEHAEHKAKIITGNEKPTECISSVHVNAIDGEQVYVQPLGFDLAPGRHTLTGRAAINTSFCAAVGPSNGKEKIEPLEAEFEAGKTYYVGFDHSANNRRDWKLVIWKVEG